MWHSVCKGWLSRRNMYLLSHISKSVKNKFRGLQSAYSTVEFSSNSPSKRYLSISRVLSDVKPYRRNSFWGVSILCRKYNTCVALKTTQHRYLSDGFPARAWKMTRHLQIPQRFVPIKSHFTAKDLLYIQCPILGRENSSLGSQTVSRRLLCGSVWRNAARSRWSLQPQGFSIRTFTWGHLRLRATGATLAQAPPAAF